MSRRPESDPRSPHPASSPRPLRFSFAGRVVTIGVALAILTACPREGGAAQLALSCADPQPVASERPGPKAGPVRKTLEIEVDTMAETMVVDERVARLRTLPDRYVWMGPLTRAGGLSHHDYVVVDRVTNEARLGEMSPEGVSWGLVRYRCEVRPLAGTGGDGGK